MNWTLQEIYVTVAGSLIYLMPTVALIKLAWDDWREEKASRREHEQNKKAS